MPGEPIGEIPVIITGDFSKLNDALSESIIAAELGGQKIANAFTTAAGGADKMDSALEALAQNIAATGGELVKWDAVAAKTATDAVTAAGGIDKLAQSAQTAAQPVMSLGDALAEWGKSAQVKGQVDALNESLAQFANTAGQQITPAVQQAQTATFGWGDALKLLGVSFSALAIKEFVVDALEAFAAVEKATVAIAALTGSAETAARAIEDLKSLALTDALSFPELVRAEQRMIAFGFSTQQIPGLLKVVADTSAAVGINFNQMANVFERVIETGNLQGRQLVQLGINVRDLAAAMNSTEAEAPKLFKSLDQADRIQVLEAALAKFSGTAEKTAQTLSGQWTNLGTQLTITLQHVGEALAIPAEGLIKLADTALKSADITAQAFDLITKSAQQFAVAADGVGKTLAQQFPALGETYQKAKDLADGVDSAALKLEGLHAVLGIISAPMLLLASAMEAAAKAAEKLGLITKDSTDKAKSGLVGLQSQWDSTTSDIIEKQATADEKAIHLYDTVQKLHKAAQDGVVPWDAYNRALKEYKAALDEANNSTKNHVLSIGELSQKMQEGTAEVNKAMQVVKQAQVLDDGSASSKVLLAEAVKQLTAASKKYSDQITDANVLAIIDIANTQAHIDKVLALAEAWSVLYNKLGPANLATQSARAEFDKMRTSLGLLPSDLQRIQDGLNPIGPAFKALGVQASENLAQLASNAKLNFQLISESGVGSAGDLIKAWDAWQKENKLFIDSLSASQTAAHLMGITTVADLNSLKDRYLELISQMRQSGEGAWDAIRAAMDKVRDLQDKINAAMDPLTQAYKTLGIESAKQLQIDLDRKKAALEAISGQVEYQKGLEAVQKAQEKLNEALGITKTNVTGIGAAADSTGSKLKSALEGAIPASQKLEAALKALHGELTAIDQGMVNMAKHSEDFTKNLSASSQGFSTGKADLAVGSIPAHTHLDYALWGISGARVVPDNGYYFDISGNVVESDWHSGATSTGAPQSASTSAPAAPVATAPKLPADVQAFIDQLSGLSGSSFVSVTGGFERVKDLLDKVAATGLIPPEAIANLTSSLNTVVSTLDTNTATLAAFTPVIAQASTQIAEAVQQQSASFARLSDALAPVNAPPTINAGTPAAFQRLTGTASQANTTSVNNIQIQPTQRLSDIMNMMQEELQRMGIRW